MEIPIIHFKFANNQIVMSTKRYRKPHKSKELTYEDIKGIDLNNLSPEDYAQLEQYGFGSWLKKNVGNVLQVGAGAALALTTPITGPAGLAGIGMMASGVGGMTNDATQQDQLEAQKSQAEQIEQQQLIANKTQALYNPNQPMYGAVMEEGGAIPKDTTNINTRKKYFVNTPSGRKEISEDNLDEIRKYLAIEKKMADYYGKTYKTRIGEVNKEIGTPSVEGYTSYLEKYPDRQIPAHTYKQFLDDKVITPEEYEYIEKYRNEYIPTDTIRGTKEATTLKPTDTGYSYRNFITGSSLGLEEEIIPDMKDSIPEPVSRNITWEPYRGYAGVNIGYENVQGKRIPTSFRNTVGREVSINPKIGMDPNMYPEMTKEFQFEVPKKKFGGTIDYSGQTHDGPNGGVPVDGMGNPNKANASALVEKGEVSYNTPDGGTYIYSDSLKHSKDKTFANKAKDIKGKYKFRMNNGVINDPYTKKAYDAEMLQLQEAQEQLREFTGMKDNLPNSNLPEGKNGIYINPENRGKFNATKERTGKTTEELTHSPNPLTRKRAIFAQNAAKWSKEYGGDLPMYDGTGTTQYLPKGSQDWTMVQNPENFSTAYEDLNAMLDQDAQEFRNYYSPSRLKPSIPKSNIPLPIGNEVRTSIMNDNTNNAVKTQSIPYQGMNWGETALAAAGPVLSGVAGLISEGMNKSTPRRLSLNRMTPQQISLERSRLSAREEANIARANMSRRLRGASPTTGGYMANIIAGETGVQRELGKQLGESYTQEELTNAQYRQQADATNAELGAREAEYNTSMGNTFDMQRKARINSAISQIGQGVTGALSQKFQSSRDADYLNAINPNYQLTTDMPVDASWWQRNMAINRRRWTPR